LEKDRDKRYQGVNELTSELASIEEEISTEERIFPRKRTRVVTPRKRFQTLRIGGILFAAVILIIIGYILFNQFFQPENSIAVLPFKDLSPQQDYEYLCFAMRNAIAEKLTQIEGWRMISETYVMAYRDTEKDIKTIGKELQVDTILESNLQVENGRISINVTLSSAKDGFQIWAGTFNKESKSHFEFQDDISQTIALVLKGKLIEEKLDILKAKEPTSDEAFEYFSKGWNFIERKFKDSESEEDFNAGLKMYARAIEADPNYALAYWGLGCAYEARFIRNDVQEDYFSMVENFRKAHTLNPDLAEANVSMGWVHFYSMDNDQAFEYFKKAYSIEADNPSINYDVGSFLRSIGLYRPAIEFYSRTIKFDPLNKAAYRILGSCAMYTGEFDKANNYFQKALDIDPVDPPLFSHRVALFIFMKDFEEAENALARIEEIRPDSKQLRRDRAWLLAAKGEKEEALKLMDEEELYRSYATSIYSLLGMKDEAIENINIGIEEGFKKIQQYMYSYPYLKNNPCYDNLRDDPRFKEIERRQKKEYDEKLKKYRGL
jgi:TolB-like protein/Tfp pilus assembly protein PilF